MAERAALITGGSGGIGLAIATRLCQSGYAVTISGRNEEKLVAAAEGLADRDYKVEAVVANVTEEQAIVDLVKEHKRQWGRLDCLVNNAGVGIGQSLDTITSKHMDLQIGINLRAIVIATRESVEMLKAAGEEHGKALVVNMASVAGHQSPAWLSVYGATKAAVSSFSKSSQKELGAHGVQVTALSPGFVATDMTEFAQEQVPADQMMTTNDIAEAVSFLLATSGNCAVPEIVLQRLGSGPDTGGM